MRENYQGSHNYPGKKNFLIASLFPKEYSLNMLLISAHTNVCFEKLFWKNCLCNPYCKIHKQHDA